MFYEKCFIFSTALFRLFITLFRSVTPESTESNVYFLTFRKIFREIRFQIDVTPIESHSSNQVKPNIQR